MNFAKIEEIVRLYDAKGTGKLGVGFRDLKTGRETFLRGDQPFPAASTFKLFVLAELFRMVEEGQCKLTDRHEMTDAVRSRGSGVLNDLDSGLNLTLKDYATLMMIISDNTAADFLLAFTGRDNVKAHVLDKLGLKNTKVDLPCSKLIAGYYENNPEKQPLSGGKFSYRDTVCYRCELEQDDVTSPEDAAKMLELMYRGQWVSQAACDGMTEIMKACQTNGRIPKFLPDDVEVAHKTGTMDKVANDVGILYTPKGDYILTLFYNGNLASEEEYAKNVHGRMSESLLAELSLEIYQAYMEE